MILKYKATNFYSINEPMEVNFVVNDKSPDTNGYTTTQSGYKVTKILGVFGANASGKTNLLKVLPYIRWLMTLSFKMDDGGNRFHQFIFNDGSKQLTELEVNFDIEGDVYLYTIKLSPQKIFSENLRLLNKITKKYKNLFTRNWDENHDEYVYSSTKQFNISSTFKKAIRSNATVISTGVAINHQLSISIANYWKNIVTNVDQEGFVAGEDLFETSEYFNKYKDKFSVAVEILKKYDLGVTDVSIEQLKVDNEKLPHAEPMFIPTMSHKSGDKVKKLPVLLESTGTRSLYCILKLILETVENGGILVLDEFANNLHPMMLNELLDLFLHNKSNPHNAQLLVTTHQPEILNRLDKYQVVLVERNTMGSTEAWRLDSVKNVRVDDNLYGKYLAGAYGGIPVIQ